jgi:L-asparaginase
MAPKSDARGVLLIYTGGTLGSLPEDPRDPLSPLVPAPLDKVMEMLPLYDPLAKQLLLGEETIRLETYSWPEPVDSSNITPRDWEDMAAVIRSNYDEYEGFVILHGTDTLAYTASALTFILANVDRPIVLTGSQLPIGQLRSDAVQNLVTSIEIAAAASLGGTVIPEVSVFFRDRLYRGCRVTKFNATSYDAFGSPNFPELATAGERILVNEAVLAEPSPYALRVSESLEDQIACMTIFPGMSPDLLRSMLNAEGLRGIVLQTFGTGNAPSTPEFLDVIEAAVKSGRIIVDITQCPAGEVELGLYEVSAGLLARGVISGMDMTPEAALAKLAVVLGEEPDLEVAADRMQLNLRGEQRRSVFNLHFGPGKVNGDGVAVLTQARHMVDGAERYRPEALERAVLRVTGLSVPGEESGRIEFKAFVDLPEAGGDSSAAEPHFLGAASKQWAEEQEKQNVFFEVTEQARAFVDNRHESTISIVSSSGAPLAWERLDMALFSAP